MVVNYKLSVHAKTVFKVCIMKKTVWPALAGGMIIIGILFWYIFTDTNTLSASAQPTVIKTERDSVDLGIVKYGEKKHAVFKITNRGDSPLIIRDVRTSCGCTNASWDKRPVKPGKTTELSVVFEPNSLGKFIKSIDILCNIPEKVYSLKIIGQVEEK